MRPNPTDLTGKRILMTGGAGAIGRVITKALVAHGAQVCVNDIMEESQGREFLEVDEVREGALYMQGDITQEADVTSLFDRAEGWDGLPDVVCCHAGMVVSGPIQDYAVADFDRVMALNVRGSFLIAREAARRWIEKGQTGNLIFTTSWVQDVPWPGIAPYSASKAAMRSLMRSMARELAPNGIRANAVAPGIVGVGMAKKQWDEEPDYKARASKAIPLGAMQTPESVANAFIFLASPMADYMTGSVLLVDGGCSLYPMD